MATTSAADVVGAFIAAIEARDLDKAITYVTDDVEYDNVPMNAVRGPDGIRKVLGPFMERATGVEFVVHHQAAEGDVVMNERTDRFELKGKWIEAKVAGLFVVRDGKIALWRDYFDLAQFQNAMGG
jgi:limonene-1,2-epoxide hydrolase